MYIDLFWSAIFILEDLFFFVSKLVPLPDIYTNQPSLPPAPVRVLDYIWLMLVLTAKCTIDITYVVGVENINH